MLEWTSELSVGVVEIDEQHRELFLRINRLMGALDDRTAAAEVRTLFSFLDSYIVEHFGTEARYMDDYAVYGYADAEHHKSEHAAFIRDFAEFRADIEAAEPDHRFITEFRAWMKNWWLLHIRKVDTGLGAFLQGAFPMISRKPSTTK
jgi:hemerythrin